MELNSDNVNRIFLDCLFRDGEETDNHVAVEGIVGKFDFHPDRLKSNAENIGEMLNDLPDEFKESSGDGWSFLNACNNKAGVMWTDLHQRMEQLVCLGIGIGKVKFQLPKWMWSALPGGMPYFVVLEHSNV